LNVISSEARNLVRAKDLKDTISPRVYPEHVEGAEMTDARLCTCCEIVGDRFYPEGGVCCYLVI
jgi:hypothetical protein